MALVALNEILITPKFSNTAIGLIADLYDIESTNTTEVRSQSVSTDNGNEHTVQKLSEESLIATKIPSGDLELFTGNINGRLIQRSIRCILAIQYAMA